MRKERFSSLYLSKGFHNGRPASGTICRNKRELTVNDSNECAHTSNAIERNVLNCWISKDEKSGNLNENNSNQTIFLWNLESLEDNETSMFEKLVNWTPIELKLQMKRWKQQSVRLSIIFQCYLNAIVLFLGPIFIRNHFSVDRMFCVIRWQRGKCLNEMKNDWNRKTWKARTDNNTIVLSIERSQLQKYSQIDNMEKSHGKN